MPATCGADNGASRNTLLSRGFSSIHSQVVLGRHYLQRLAAGDRCSLPGGGLPTRPDQRILNQPMLYQYIFYQSLILLIY